MLIFARILYLFSVALALGCIIGFALLTGRRTTPIIDAPEFIPWTVIGLIFSVGLAFVAQVLGNDLAPHLPGGRKRAAVPSRSADRAKTARPFAGDRADAQMVYDYITGQGNVTKEENGRAYRRWNMAQEAAMTPQQRARRDAIANLKVDAAPCRLQVLVPPVPSDSWVGGNPSLPPDMPWPDVDGKPARFYAQIAAHHLPPDIWGWQGPRSGWLLFFGGDEEFGDGLILQTTELGQERERPYGQVFRYYRFGRYDDQALQMMGDQGLQPPRWPVKVVPSDMETRRAEIAERLPGQGFDLSNEAWLPFDWPTLGIFVSELIGQIHWDLRIYRKVTAPDKVAVEGSRIAALDAVLPSLETLAELIRRRAETTPFTLAERDRILQPILDLQHDAPIYDNGVLKGMGKVRVTGTLRNSEYAALHDLRARHVYARDPDALHPPVRALYEPQWQAIAAEEVITMGGSAAKFERDDAVMLELVPSRLFGWTFGDLSNFAILLGKGDLLDGALDKAQTVNNHGL